MSLPFQWSNYRAHALLCFLLAFSLNWTPAISSNRLAESGELDTVSRVSVHAVKGRSELSASPGALQLSFEANQGQTNKAVKFLARAGGHFLFLTPTETVISLHNRGDQLRGRENRSNLLRADENNRTTRSPARTIVRMKFEAANPAPIVEGVNELPGKSNYFSGSDPAKWQTDIPTYSQVRYREVYPGVDMVYYGSQRQLEYDLVVAPNADPRIINFRFAGIEGIKITDSGELLLLTAGGSMRQSKPRAYQLEKGVRRQVSCSYVRKRAGLIGFQLGEYDRSKPVIIDPVLVYSSYLGGNGWDQAYDIAVDYAGNAYVTGKTAALDFPTTPGAFQTSFSLGDALFVTKLNSEGTGLVYSTYINGASGNGIAVDFAGNAYVTGEASTLNFPTTPGSFQTDPWGFDTFVTKLNATGSALIYSARFGGNFDDFGRAIALDAAGNAYITGWTVCLAPTCTFPTVNAFQPNYGGGYNDAFVTKINNQGSALVYSTYLGGGQILNATEDWGEGIAVDSSGSAYVTGYTYSPDFPITPGAYDTSRAGLDAFVTKFTPDGKLLVYSTFLGSAGRELGQGIAVDQNGNAYVTGTTESFDNPYTPEYDGFPVTPGAFQTNGSYDAFVTKLNPQGSMLVYSTYLGGTGGVERGWGIAIDGAGNAYITGDTRENSFNSNNFPVANAIQGSYGGGLSDAFVSKLNATGTVLVYSTYIGGNLSDEGRGIAVDTNGSAYVAGLTSSYNFPVTPTAFQIQNAGGLEHHDDAFILKIGAAAPTPTPTPTPTPVPSVSLSSLTLNPTSVLGGSSTQGTVVLSGVAPNGGAVVSLYSSDATIASVAPTITVAAGTISANFTFSTNLVTTVKSVTINATFGGVTRSASLTVRPTDIVTVQRAEYMKKSLRVDATSTDATATLKIYVTSTGALIGTMKNRGVGYSAVLSWPVNPVNITVRSNLGGVASSAVSLR
jgi:hypothetical protein